MRGALLSRDPGMTQPTPLVLPGLRHELYWIPGDRSVRSADRPPLCSYPELAAHFPPDRRPDVFFHWSLEYLPPPAGVEDADCITVAALGDWNLGAQALHALGGAFDLIFTDRAGCDRLRALGYENTCYAPLWSYNPNLHRRLPEMERDLNVVIVGSFNHEVQRERAKWLGRVARLSRRWNVCVTTGVYGEEYTRLLNRAKIVFNRSIRGEINMRVYESLACGALLFHERENREIRDLLTDQQECVLYGDDDLEALLEHYLTHEAERARIAEAGWRAVQPCTDALMYNRIFDAVEERREQIPPRAYREQAPEERARRRAYHALVMPHRGCLEPILSEQEGGKWGETRETDDPLLACLIAERARVQSEPAARKAGLRKALRAIRDLLRRHPNHVSARLNLAAIHDDLDESAPAVMELQAAVRALQSPDLPHEALSGPYIPRRFDLFTVELERIWAQHPPDSDAWREAMRVLLMWRALGRLADCAEQTRDYSAVVTLTQQALLLRPDLHPPRLPLARALRALGRPLEAEPHYRALLEEIPLQPDVWTELATLLRETKQWDACRIHLEEVQALLDGCPAHDAYRPTLRLLRSALDRSDPSS